MPSPTRRKLSAKEEPSETHTRIPEKSTCAACVPIAVYAAIRVVHTKKAGGYEGNDYHNHYPLKVVAVSYMRTFFSLFPAQVKRTQKPRRLTVEKTNVLLE